MRIIILIALSLILSSCMPRLEYEAQTAEVRQEPAIVIDNPDDKIISIFKGAMSDGYLFETLVAQAGIEEGSSFYSLAFGKTIAEFSTPKSNKDFDYVLVYDNRIASIEWEANIAKHFGKQDNLEINFLIFTRWHLSPFSLAFGEGLSLASDTPYYETVRWPKSNQLLNNMTFELALELPYLEIDETSELLAVLRLHHRSGIYGLFNGVHGASNVVALGLRVRYF